MTIRYALHAIRRYRSRYLLFGLVMVALISVCFVNLTLGTIAGEICEEIKREFGGYMRIVATTPGGNDLTREEYLAFGETELVEAVEFRSVVWHNHYTVLRTEDREDTVPDSSFWMIGFNPDYPNPLMRDPAVLVAGRMPEAENECLMSEEFFAYLCADGVIGALGDRFLRADRVQTYIDGRYVNSYTYSSATVVGLLDSARLELPYQDLHAENDHYLFFPYAQVCAITDDAAPKQTIYNTHAYGEARELSTGYDVRYRLRSYTDGDAFRAHVEEQLYATYASSWDHTGNGIVEAIKKRNNLQRDLIAESVMPDFEQLLPPLEQLQTFTHLTTVTLCLLAVATVALMSIINMRERKYELGVLRCIGMSRRRITMTLTLESLVFLLTAAILGILCGSVVFLLTGDAMLDLSVVETAIDTQSVGYTVAGLLGGGALLLSAFASGLCAAYVMRVRPLAILRNRT